MKPKRPSKELNVGDRVQSVTRGVEGTVKDIVERGEKLDIVKVKWDNGRTQERADTTLRLP